MSDNTPEYTSLLDLCTRGKRGFRQQLEALMDREVYISADKADELMDEWLQADAERTQAELLQRQRAQAKAERDALLAEGRQLLSLIEQNRLDLAATRERAEWANADDVQLWQRRVEQSENDLQASLDAWTAWRREHEAAAVAVEELAKAGNPERSADAWVPPRPDWQAEALEQQAAETARQAERDRQIAEQAIEAYKRTVG